MKNKPDEGRSEIRFEAFVSGNLFIANLFTNGNTRLYTCQRDNFVYDVLPLKKIRTTIQRQHHSYLCNPGFYRDRYESKSAQP